MKIEQNGVTVFIADDSVIAQKIEAGFDYTVDQVGRITIGAMGTGIRNRYQAKKAIQAATTLADIKAILIKIVDLI